MNHGSRVARGLGDRASDNPRPSPIIADSFRTSSIPALVLAGLAFCSSLEAAAPFLGIWGVDGAGAVAALTSW